MTDQSPRAGRPARPPRVRHHAWTTTGTLIPDGAVAILGRRIVDVGAGRDGGRAVCAPRRTIDAARRAGPSGARRDAPARLLPDVPRRRPRPDPRGGRLPHHRAPLLRRRDRRGGGAGLPALLPGDGPQRHDVLPRGGHRAGARGRCARPPRRVGIRARPRRRLHHRPGGRLRAGQGGARNRPALHLAGHPRTSTRRSPGWAAQLRRNDDPDALVRGHVAVLGLGTASARRSCSRPSDARARRASCSTCTTPTARRTRRPTGRATARDPLLHLADIGVLDRNTTLGHANHLTDAECEVLIETAARASPGRRRPR